MHRTSRARACLACIPWVMLHWALISGTLSAHASDTGSDGSQSRAKDLYLAGTAEARAGRWPEARDHFDASFKLDRQARTALGLARAHFKLKEYVAARRMLYQFERLARPGDARAEARELRAAVNKNVALLALALNPPNATVTLDKRPVPPWQIRFRVPMDPGKHQLGVNAQGYQPVSHDLEVEAGERLSADIQLQPATGAESGSLSPGLVAAANPPQETGEAEEAAEPSTPWVVIGIAGVLMAAVGIGVVVSQ